MREGRSKRRANVTAPPFARDERQLWDISQHLDARLVDRHQVMQIAPEIGRPSSGLSRGRSRVVSLDGADRFKQTDVLAFAASWHPVHETWDRTTWWS